jgi:hypothetical protein
MRGVVNTRQEATMTLDRPSRRIFSVGLVAAAGAAIGLPPGRAAGSELYTDIVPGVAAGGYDVVAYVAEGRPTPGSAAIVHAWRGADWRFKSAENRAAFIADPARYAPAYGGHCAWAASQGYKAKGDPRNWRIVDGRLFLNYDDDVQKRWEQDIPGFIRKADAGWPALRLK